jgi:acyl-CoA synthetase (AMP-forming)/AMP-acid ligase II
VTFASAYPPILIPDRSLDDFVLDGLESLGDKAAIIDVDSGRGYSYRQLGRHVEGVASELGERSLERGQSVAVVLPKRP